MHGISCTGFHVPHLAYQGILLQTRLIRLVTENRGAERDREKLIYLEGTREILSFSCNVEHAKQTIMYLRINVSLREISIMNIYKPYNRTALDFISHNKLPRYISMMITKIFP